MKSFFARLRPASITFPLAFVAALGLLLISEYSYNRSMSSMAGLERVVAVRLTIQTLLRQVLSAESGQRGYLLTNGSAYLESYEEAVAGVGKTLGDLVTSYSASPREIADYRQLELAVVQKLSEMALTVQLKKQGRTEAWQGIVETDIGREQMTVIRHLADRFVKAGTERIAAEHKLVQDTLMLSRVGIAAMAVLSLIAMALYLRQSQALTGERALREKALQAERDTLELLVRERTRHLAELANHLQSVREDERAHLARELHDELGALLTTAKLDVARIKSRLKDRSPEASERITHLTETLNGVIALKRRIIEDLRPSSLSNLGLPAALEILTREFGERSDMSIHGVFEKATLTPSGELTVYRLVQEALTNAAKYAKASEVRIELRALPQHAEISVRDDGTGFDPQAMHDSAHGLLGMRYRVEGAGGRMEINSRPGAGTQILAVLPLAPPAPPAETQSTDDSTVEAPGSSSAEPLAAASVSSTAAVAPV